MDQPSFWVVETARTTYWDGRQAGREVCYTPDISEAMKFHSFDDADRARCWLLRPYQETLRSVEHMFVEPPARDVDTSYKRFIWKVVEKHPDLKELRSAAPILGPGYETELGGPDGQHASDD